jgi:DNA-binding XRE family transcriptional regulator
VQKSRSTLVHIWHSAAPSASILSTVRLARSNPSPQMSNGGCCLRRSTSHAACDQRNAAKVIGVSPSTVCRLESGKPVSIASMIKVCAFIGVHPDGYTEPHQVGQRGGVSRETPTETHCSDLEIRHGTAAHA